MISSNFYFVFPLSPCCVALYLQEFHLTGFTFAFMPPAPSVLLLPEEKWGSFGSHITDDTMASIQLLAACAAMLSVPILCICHSGVMDDGVLPGLGILAWICFLNLFRCPGPLASSGPSSVFQFSLAVTLKEQTTSLSLEW